MELPQPSRPFGPEGRKATHDFLSLRTHSPVQHDPRPSSHGCPKTHNFLQPLEKDHAKENHTVDVTVDKPPPLPSTEHILPGGIGTYSISHISYFSQRIPKPEEGVYAAPAPAPAPTSSYDKNDENSNCSSYTAGSGGGGGGFTLWGEQPSANKGKTQKENLGEINFTKESLLKSGQWSKEMPSESSSTYQNNLSSRSSSQPPAHRSQSFMDMIKSAKGGPLTKEEVDDEYFSPTKEGTSRRGELRIKVDGKRSSTDQKANTPRSKHSATEQRRRCKINDRFQALREIIPHGDQKRDKASFLLEVIEYIQFLQEKVTRYESSYPPAGWSGSEPPKPTSWRNTSPNPAEGFPDRPRSIAQKDENNLFMATSVTRMEKNPAGAEILSGDINNNNAAAPNASMDTLTNKAAPSVALQPEIFSSSSVRNMNRENGGAVQSVAHKLPASDDADNRMSMSQLQLWRSRQQQQEPHVSSVKSSDNTLHQHQKVAVEGGTINISSIYSQGLLNTLTQALQSSGVDLSQATISVQVDVGKRANNGPSVPTATAHSSKDGEVKGKGRAFVRERGDPTSSGRGDPDLATKRLKKTG